MIRSHLPFRYFVRRLSSECHQTLSTQRSPRADTHHSYISKLQSLLQMSAKLKDPLMGKMIHGQICISGEYVDTLMGNILINFYSKCGLVSNARNVFDEMSERSLVSWNTMISAYTRSGDVKEAFDLLIEMRRAGMGFSEFTVSSVLCACAAGNSLYLCQQLHAFAHKVFTFWTNVFVATALVDVYAKCGLMSEATMVFDSMEDRTEVTWSSLMAGYVTNEMYDEALCLFHRAQVIGLGYNQFMISSAVCACAGLAAIDGGKQVHGLLRKTGHMGLVENGRKYFSLILTDVNISPNVLHYSCMVDVLGRTGLLSEAMNLIKTMPFDATSSIWGSLLSSCRTHGNIELAEIAAKFLFELEPENGGNHVLLSNIYANYGNWKNVAKVRKLLKDSGEARKERGKSWIQIKGKVHTFMVSERHHPSIVEIYSELDELFIKMEELGYLTQTDHDLHDVENERKEELLRHHSEKLAFVYGHMSIPESLPVRIMKNLRICGDCHSFMKFASTVTGREIIIRDINRFHHFSHGICSCGDFW